jgi:hypothetical protein
MSYLITTADDNAVVMDTALPTGPRVANPVLKVKQSAADSFTFTIDTTHPVYPAITLRHWLQILDRDTGETRMVRFLDPDLQGTTATYSCEGTLAALNDTLATRDDNYFSGPPADFIDWILAPHNAQAVDADGNPDPYRQIVRGVVSADLDPNNLIVRSIDTSPTLTTAEFLARSTYKSSAGGFLRLRTVNGINYLDWLSAGVDSGVTIRYAVTLEQWKEQLKAAQIVTACWPEGAQSDDGNPEDNPPRLHLDSTTQGAVELWPGSGRYGFVDTAAEALYGRIVGTNTWDDVTTPTALLQRAAAWVSARKLTQVSLDVKSADIDLLHPGDIATVIVPDPVDINAQLSVASISKHLTDRTKWSISMGAEAETFMSKVTAGRRAADQVIALQSSSARLGEAISETRQTTLMLESSIDQTASAIRAEVSETYATQGALDAEVQARQVSVQISADGVLAQFNNWKNNTYSNEMGGQQSNWEELNLWQRTSATGMEFGRTNSSFSTHIDDDEFTIAQNGVPQFSARGNRVSVGALRAREYLQVGSWRWMTVIMPGGETFGLVWTQETEETA